MSGAPALEPESVTLLVIAKEPVPGRVKTRLAPAVGEENAARLAAAALADTLAAVGALPGRKLLALDGEADGWVPGGFEVTPQRGAGLAERLAAAFEDAGGPALLVGMDTPQLDSPTLEHARRELASPGCDAVIGGAPDGGYWAIGLRRPDRRAFEGVPMSDGRTGEIQRRRLRELGLRVSELGELADVDTIEDAHRVASEAPGTRFAGELRRLGVSR